MKNFKKGDLVFLKNGDPKEILVIEGKYKISDTEYSYELMTLDNKILDDDYSDSDFIKYKLSIPNKELNERLIFNYKDEMPVLEDCNLLINNFKEEQIELIHQIVDIYSYDSASPYNILNIIKANSAKNKKTMIEFTSKYVPYILNTIEQVKIKNTHLNIESIINNGLMMHLYNTMENNKYILYKRILVNSVISELESIEEFDIFGYINNVEYYCGDNANALLILNPPEILSYIEEYLEEIKDIPFNKCFELRNKIEGFFSFLKEKVK